VTVPRPEVISENADIFVVRGWDEVMIKRLETGVGRGHSLFSDSF
jgi:hypothetical protein